MSYYDMFCTPDKYSIVGLWRLLNSYQPFNQQPTDFSEKRLTRSVHKGIQRLIKGPGTPIRTGTWPEQLTHRSS